MAKELSKEELDERIAILKRFRKLLEQQRNKFQEYLTVLESQEGKIEAEDGDSIAAHTELESQIVKNLASLQKVIVPMQGMYNAIKPGLPLADNSIVEQLKLDLASLQKQVLAQNERNRTVPVRSSLLLRTALFRQDPLRLHILPTFRSFEKHRAPLLPAYRRSPSKAGRRGQGGPEPPR